MLRYVAAMGTSRRTFLAAGGTLLLAACGGSSKSEDSGTEPVDAGLNGAVVLGRWNNTVLVPGMVRPPVSFGRDGNIATGGPERVSGRILDLDDKVIADGLVGERHNSGIPNAYWLFSAELSEPGLYRLVVDSAAPDGQALQVNDPSLVLIPKVGEPLPPFDTPTASDGRGVDPICTRDPFCPFHDLTLTEALATGKPVAYLIGTPAYCQTGFCGPILELMMNVRDQVGDDAVFVHSEVYTDSTITTAAPAVTAYQLDFEPLMYVTNASGTIVHRLDAAFDEAEILDAVTSAISA